jgi:hypothetical protein
MSPKVNGRVAHPLSDTFDNRGYAVVINVVRRDHLEADLSVMNNILKTLFIH